MRMSTLYPLNRPFLQFIKKVCTSQRRNIVEVVVVGTTNIRNINDRIDTLLLFFFTNGMCVLMLHKLGFMRFGEKFRCLQVLIWRNCFRTKVSLKTM